MDEAKSEMTQAKSDEKGGDIEQMDVSEDKMAKIQALVSDIKRRSSYKIRFYKV